MKSVINRVILSFVLVTLAGAVAFAKTRKTAVTLTSDVKVSDKVVKKGTYDIAYDDQTGELSILKGHKVIVRTSTRVEKLDRKVPSTAVRTILEGMDQRLVSFSFAGSDQSLVVSSAAMMAGGN